MIDKISHFLQKNGLVDVDTTLRFNFLLTQGTCIVAEVTGGRGEAFFVKFSELSDLEEEFGRLEQAKRHFHEFVPRQYGYYRQSPFNLIISERVAHSTVSASAILSRPAVGKRIEQFFSYSRETIQSPCKEDSRGLFMESAIKYLSEKGIEVHSLKSIKASALAGTPVVPQHGDLVLNNFGWKKKNLYIFDWEDYGKASLPGLDLATLVFSIVNFDAKNIRGIMESNPAANNAISGLVKRCCARMDMDQSLFLRMLPLYLALFYYLKREYGPKVQSIVRACLVELEGR